MFASCPGWLALPIALWISLYGYGIADFSMSNILRSQLSLPDRPDVLGNVAMNLRRLRRDRGMNQTALAQMSGLSRRMISAIEGGETNVSLASIDRLAAALSVTFTQLVRPVHAADSKRVTSRAWQGAAEGSEAMLLGAVPSKVETELWLWSLGAGDSYRSEAHSDDWHEMIFVVEGALTLELGEATFRIAQGDFKIFSGASTCIFGNREAAVVRFIRTVAQ